MRSKVLIVALVGLFGAADAAFGQYCYYPPPTAPNFYHPTYACRPWAGYPYAMFSNVYPPFPPFQGHLPAPDMRKRCRLGNCGMGGGGMGGGAMDGPPELPPASPGMPGVFPFARSPRDFFMYETEPAASAYRYGPVSMTGGESR